MEIVILHPHFTLPGGAGTFALNVGKRLTARGHRVIIVSLRSEGSVVGSREHLEFVDLKGPLSSSFWYWMTFPIWQIKVNRILDAYPEAVLFPQVFPSNWWAFLYKWLHPKRKLIWMCQEPSAFLHSPDWLMALPLNSAKIGLICTRPFLRWLDVRLVRSCDNIICNSHFGQLLATNTYGLKVSPFITYPGVDLHVFHPLNMARSNQIVTLCRLTKFKHVELVLEALSLVNKNRSQPIQLKVIGEGEEKTELIKRARLLGISNAVSFLGQTSTYDVVQILNQSKAFVQASVNEPFGIAPIEAMACGTPAIVSNSGGMKETVLHKQTGFHFPTGNTHELANAIASIMDDEKLFKKLSSAAIKRARSFSWDTTTDKIEEILQTQSSVP